MDSEDWYDNFNTPIPEDKFYDFLKWTQQESEFRGRDILQDMKSYDMQGYWLNKGWEQIPSENLVSTQGHFPDTYKKPNHPTFSDESIYHGKSGYVGGHWEQNGEKWSYQPSSTNIGLHTKKGLSKYFLEHEPDVEVIWGD